MSTLSEQARRVPSDADFGTRLAMVRQHMGWNTAKAARECGVPEATWRTWEEGSRPRDYEKACRSIAHKADVDLIWLLTGQTVPEPSRQPDPDDVKRLYMAQRTNGRYSAGVPQPVTESNGVTRVAA